jgi:hypothetical protein
MDELSIPVTVRRMKGNPLGGKALLERTMRGGLVVALVNQVFILNFLGQRRQFFWKV